MHYLLVVLNHFAAWRRVDYEFHHSTFYWLLTLLHLLVKVHNSKVDQLHENLVLHLMQAHPYLEFVLDPLKSYQDFVLVMDQLMF